MTLPSIRWGVAYGVTLTVARSLGEFGAVLVVSGNLIGQTQTATLYIHDGIESFHTEGAYAASLVLAALSFVLLVGMEAVRRRSDRHEQGRTTVIGLSSRERFAVRNILPSGTGRSRRWTTSRSTCRPGSSSPCSGPRARARARSCGSSPAWRPAETGTVELTGEDATAVPIQQRGRRVRVPALRPVPPHDRAREHRVRPEGAQAAAGRDPRRGSTSCWTWSS